MSDAIQRGLYELLAANGVQSEIEALGSVDVTEEVLLMAAKLTGRPSFAREFGEQVTLPQLGTLGFALMSCRNVGEALSLLVKYHPIVSKLYNWKLTAEGEWVSLAAVPAVADPAELPHLTEATFACILAIGSELIAPNRLSGSVEFSHPSMASDNAAERLSGLPVSYEQQGNRFVIPKAMLSVRVNSANTAAREMFTQQCEGLLRGRNSTHSIAGRVQSLLIRSSGDFPSCAEAAESQYMSERSLRRKLADEGTSYSQVLAEVRNAIAKNYLSATHMDVGQVAILLGYSDTANFRRAFVTWNGCTPSEFRRS